MSSTVHILGVAGSLRKDSVNKTILRTAAEELAPEGVSIEIFDLASIPFYNGDLDGGDAQPEPVMEFKRKIRAADALYIVTPEYNYSIPGVLKNAIDWASRPPKSSPLFGKPAAIAGGGGMSGTARGQMHLRVVLASTGVWVLPKPEVFIPHVGQKVKDGRLIDEETRRHIHAQLAALAAFVRQMRGEPTPAHS